MMWVSKNSQDSIGEAIVIMPLHIRQADYNYPQILNQTLENHAPKDAYALDDLNLPQQEAIALFCSVKCPGNTALINLGARTMATFKSKALKRS